MKNRFLLLPLYLLTVSAFAADVQKVPTDPAAIKKDLLFSDDFNRSELGDSWGVVVPTFTIENGALKGTQTRVTKPAADGKPAVVGHQAVIGSNVPTKDSVIEVRFKFAGATSLSVEFDDRKFTGSHYGHICRVAVTPKDVRMEDQKDGSMRNDIYAMSQDASRRAERNKLLEGKSARFPVTLDPDKWYSLVLETVGDTMRASIDGKPVAFLKSPGIAHPTKSKIELGCAGKDGFFDDIKIYNADPTKP